MSSRSTAAQFLVPLGVLGGFAAIIGVAVTTVVSNREARNAALQAEIVRLEGDRAEAQSQLEKMTREMERWRARHAIAVRVSSERGAAPGAAGSEDAAAAVRAVVQAADDKLNVYVIAVGSKEHVRPGMEFDVRRGDERLGTLIVDSVFENYATAKRKPGTRAFGTEPGDECTTGPSPK